MTCVCVRVRVCCCVFAKKTNAHTPPLPPVTRNISDRTEDGFINESILYSPLVRIKSTYHRYQLLQTHPVQNAHLFSHDRLLHSRQAPRLINTYILDRDMLRCNKLHRVMCDTVCTHIAGSTICSSCEAGKYSTTTGATTASTCLNCGVNTYSSTVGASANSSCNDCPSNSQSVSGSTALSSCVCNLGFTGPNGGTCSACAAGKYKIATGNAGCTDCSAGKYLTTTGATVASSCVNCDAGKFSAAVGATTVGTCSNCQAGTFSAVVGATTVGTCSNCAAGTYQSTAGVESVCVRGREGASSCATS
jgi:hypothetical protein